MHGVAQRIENRQGIERKLRIGIPDIGDGNADILGKRARPG